MANCRSETSGCQAVLARAAGLPAVFTPFAQSNETWRRWMSVVVRVPDSAAILIPEVKRRI